MKKNLSYRIKWSYLRPVVRFLSLANFTWKKDNWPQNIVMTLEESDFTRFG